MKQFTKNQKGQGIMEYVIISSLVGICCLVAMKSFGEKVRERIKDMQAQVVESIQLKGSRK